MPQKGTNYRRMMLRGYESSDGESSSDSEGSTDTSSSSGGSDSDDSMRFLRDVRRHKRRRAV
jgi:hypothetical protein